MVTKSEKTLPKMLPGVVCVQWKRCGRLSCKCTQGALHGPYYYRFWRDRGRLRKAYVRRSDVDAVRAACAAERQSKRAQRWSFAQASKELQRLVAVLKEMQKHA